MNATKVINNPSLVRDNTSKAILETSRNALQSYKLQREERIKAKNAIEAHTQLEKRISVLENKINTLNELFLKIIESKTDT